MNRDELNDQLDQQWIEHEGLLAYLDTAKAACVGSDEVVSALVAMQPHLDPAVAAFNAGLAMREFIDRITTPPRLSRWQRCVRCVRRTVQR